MKLHARSLLAVAILAAGLAGCSNDGADSAAESKAGVSYKNDVLPILSENCVRCHIPGGEGEKASGLNMTSYDNLMKGTKFGPVIKAGDSFTSVAVMLLEGRANPRLKMPHGDSRALTEKEIATIKNWIDQGAKNN